MSKNNNQMLGLVLGAVVAGLAGFLITTKTGKELCCDIADKYNDIYDDISDKAEDLTDEMKHKGWHLLHPGSESECGVCAEGSASYFVIGSLAGAILGVAAAVVLAPKSGAQIRRGISETYKDVSDNVEKGKENIEEFIDKVQAAIKAGKTGKDSSTLENIFSLANLGLTAWHKFQKRM